MTFNLSSIRTDLEIACKPKARVSASAHCSVASPAGFFPETCPYAKILDAIREEFRFRGDLRIEPRQDERRNVIVEPVAICSRATGWRAPRLFWWALVRFRLRRPEAVEWRPDRSSKIAPDVFAEFRRPEPSGSAAVTPRACRWPIKLAGNLESVPNLIARHGGRGVAVIRPLTSPK